LSNKPVPAQLSKNLPTDFGELEGAAELTFLPVRVGAVVLESFEGFVDSFWSVNSFFQRKRNPG
jgi:hypothetical protein